jgi:hypothetical protein
MSRMPLRLFCIAFVAGFFAVIVLHPADVIIVACARPDPGARLCRPANATTRRTTGDFVGILGRHLGNDFRFSRCAPWPRSAPLCKVSAVRRDRAHECRLVHRGAPQRPAPLRPAGSRLGWRSGHSSMVPGGSASPCCWTCSIGCCREEQGRRAAGTRSDSLP